MKYRWLVLCAMLLYPLSAAAGEVVVFAAASLRGALDEVARAYEKDHEAVRIIPSYAGSSALARQIEAGAPADIFISADEDWMDHLAGKGLIKPESRSDLLANSLVLIAPAAQAKPVQIIRNFPLRALLGDGRLAMAKTDAVPAGKYGKAALQALGVWATVKDHLAEAENVRAALAFVARGETPYGIVYLTDAYADPSVAVVGTFPEATHAPIRYPAALVKASAAPDANGFLSYLRGPAAAQIMKAHGFTLP